MSSPASTPISATGQAIAAGSGGRLLGITLIAAAGAAATVLVYDGTAATFANLKAGCNAAAGTSNQWQAPIQVERGGGVQFNNGLYAALTGAGAVAIIHFRT
jgi:hypothetical protein